MWKEYLEEVVEIFDKDDLALLEKVLSSEKNIHQGNIEDIMQTSFETLLKFSDEKESEKECLLRDNIKKEVAATTLNESIFEHKADATWSTTIEEEQLATIILEEELSKIKSEVVIGRKNRRERKKSFVIDYIVND